MSRTSTKQSAASDVGGWKSRLDGLVYSEAAGRFALLPLVRAGQRRFLRSGTTPRWAYAAMRKLYGNADPQLFARLVEGGAEVAPCASSDAVGVSAGLVVETVAQLRTNGYAVLPRRLDAAACDDLERAARNAVCDLVGGPASGTRRPFDEAAPVATRYDVREEDILVSPAAQRLVADPTLFEIASGYLGCTPVQDLVAMWWSAAVGEGASAAAAQQFHFDLDRLAFLKVFVYLTDVDDDTGPHEFVRGSHRSTPTELRLDRRHSDAAVERWYRGERVSIAGPRGTIFLADTRGLHKGRHLRGGHRLVFQTEYAVSLFGAPFTRPVVRHASPELLRMTNEHPQSFQRFVIDG